MVRLALLSLSLLGILVACEATPCDEYVAYMCTCHDDDPEFSCEELERTYAEAPPDVQDTCALALDEQQEMDEEEGLNCDAGI